MNKDLGHIVAVKRNRLYDDPTFRHQCAMEVLSDFHMFFKYDMDGIKEQLFPWVKDAKGKFYCSELVNHYCIRHSNEKMNLRPGKGTDDDITPYQIQKSAALISVPLVNGVYQVQEMDYVLTTSRSALAGIIRAKSAGIDDLFDKGVASHCGIVLCLEKRYWIAEMTAGGSAISSIHKYAMRK